MKKNIKVGFDGMDDVTVRQDTGSIGPDDSRYVVLRVATSSAAASTYLSPEQVTQVVKALQEAQATNAKGARRRVAAAREALAKAK